MKITYYIIGGIWWLLSLLPLKILYLFSDMLYVLVHHVIGYRKKIVRKNLTNSFPEKSLDEIKQIEKGFYHFFCDYIVETIKQFSISKEEMKRRMVISGVEEMKDRMEKENKTFCFIYLGHFCNWEWIASLPYWVPNDILCAQIYHPLYNKAFDKLFLRIRNKFGGECIPMKETLRRIIELRRAKQKTIIGFISDQAPKWNSIHHFVDFLNQETPVFIGTEKIAKQVDALVYYGDVRRVKRGFYTCEFKPMTEKPVKEIPDWELTDAYAHLLEEMISRHPNFWLWSHNRWKRTKEEWLRRKAESLS
ncbi:MAG: lysophospholipid acyltransferase family protein [Bacteroidaceae bacterium]|jgi:KDO2-lipid IV(A) lauroyltransferase|nr:lysophospholipid acyltransferase family protein [Bacteroidaceae bacterium]